MKLNDVTWVRIPLETYNFIFNLSIPACSEQLSGSLANVIKHDHSAVVIVVLDPRYDLSYKALYIYSHSIDLTRLGQVSLKTHTFYLNITIAPPWS